MSHAGNRNSLDGARQTPNHIRDELMPEIKQILKQNLKHNEYKCLLNYCIFWHPRNNAVKEAHWLNGNRNSLPRVNIQPPELARVVRDLGSQPELLRLLADRGPDYGLVLLILLELLFRIAYCMRRPQANSQDPALTEAKKHLSIVKCNCPRLLEILSLHLDCPPLWPNFRLKFGLVVMGLIHHNKLPGPALTRFYQLQHFTCPEARQFMLRRKAEAPPLDSSVEAFLWQTARELSLGQPSESVEAEVRKHERPSRLHTRMDAMAFVFERLNHLARALFGTSLCLYGSAATGFATQRSDVDVVLRLNEAAVERMLEEAREWRGREDGVDLNCFPARTQSGFSAVVGDWQWLEGRERSVSATIWAGRKFAWACYRLLGWDAQCVQTAYVPIVKIWACVQSDGRVCEVPPPFRQAVALEASLAAILDRCALSDCDPSKSSIEELQRKCGFQQWTDGKWRATLSRLIATDVIAERQYASWKPSFMPRVDEKAATMLLNTPVSAPLAKEVQEAQDLHLSLLATFHDDARRQRAAYLDHIAHLDHADSYHTPSCCRLSPTLMHAQPSEVIDDGRLSPFISAEATEAEKEPQEIWLVECDLSMARQVGIYNSRLLRAYASSDPRVVALGLLVKHWARGHQIEDAYSGYLSGYQWTLLVIHFLQSYSCLTVPEDIKKTIGWRAYESAYSRARMRKPERLPILPNLQRHKGEDGCCNLSFSHSTTIHEIEGEVDTFFYQPKLGVNMLVCDESLSVTPRGCKRKAAANTWPEDSLLGENPFGYAYALLKSPYKLEPSECGASTSLSGSESEAAAHLWRMRCFSCPRPVPTDNSDGSTSVCSSEVWDGQRNVVKERLLKSLSEQSNARESFPPLRDLRDRQFYQDHLLDRNTLLIPNWPKEPTLTELLYAFFEYYSLRFNYGTDIADIDRPPEPPCGKKEFFETSLYVPKVVQAGGVPPETTSPSGAVLYESVKEVDETDCAAAEGIARGEREVLGRGNGPFQFRGRHFLCIRDPFEKFRTIGPPYRCQGKISSAFLSGLQAMGSTENALRAVKSLFTSEEFRPTHPTKQSLAFYLKAMSTDVRRETLISDHLNSQQAATVATMYTSIAEVICQNGSYRHLIQEGDETRPLHPATSPSLYPQTRPRRDSAIRQMSDGRRRNSECSVGMRRASENPVCDMSYEHSFRAGSSFSSREPKSIAETETEKGMEGVVISLEVYKQQVEEAAIQATGDVFKFKDFEDPETWLRKQTGIPRQVERVEKIEPAFPSGTLDPAEADFGQMEAMTESLKALQPPQMRSRTQWIRREGEEEAGKAAGMLLLNMIKGDHPPPPPVTKSHNGGQARSRRPRKK